MRLVLQFSLILILPLGDSSADELSFNRDVRPILSDRCFHCHGPDADNQDSEFRLDSEEHALADLGGYAGIVPGDLEESELHRRIRSEDEDERMPPPESVRQLTDAEKDILDTWIKQGAKFERHWSFVPLRQEIAVPAPEGDWAKTDLDRFVYNRLKEHGLSPSQPASREKWLRRVTFDLTGLPPTIEELDAFVADDSIGAYEQVVDRLLESYAYAERMASEWLDVARYSDSYGYQRDDIRYAWPYRDWIIRAFQQGMSYDEFITLQLAGDLLPNATRDQQLATAFNRLHSHKKEGGSSPEEFRMEYVADRTNTVAAAFMGLTLECARCHDHKYDPIKTKEYYQLSSFFSNIDEYGLISFFTDAIPTPAMPLPTEEQELSIVEANTELSSAELALTQTESAELQKFDSWLKVRKAVDQLKGLTARLSFETFVDPPSDDKGEAKPEGNLRLVENRVEGAKPAKTNDQNKIVPGKSGNSIWLTGDDAVDIPDVGHFRRDQPFSFSLWIRTAEVNERSVIYRRSRGWDDAGAIGYELTKLGDRLSAKLCHFWPGDAIGIETESVLRPDEWFHVVVNYDGSSKAAGLTLFINGQRAHTNIVKDNLTRQITKWQGGYDDLAIGSRYRDRGFKDGRVDEFMVFDRKLSAIEVSHLFDGKSLNETLTRSVDQLSPSDRELLQEYFLLADSEAMDVARRELQMARKAVNDAVDSTSAISIMRESKTRRSDYVLVRGSYENHGEQVSPATPEFLTPFPADSPKNRLGLASWLTDKTHPLTARVTVNRYWQLMFGRGIVRTPEDFGMQGQAPTHPDLLDWLARDFLNHGWDLKRLLKQIALSETYRQSSVVSREVRNKDPENLWLARGPNQRLTAEMVRDNALATSGLLVTKLGGPPVKPYDLSTSYKPSKVDTGDGLYRRSLYTFWQRTAPTPVMMTMNASRRDVCRLRREVVDSPLQAFVLLNSPQFVEAARVLAGNLLSKHAHENDIDSLIGEAFRILTSRKPSAPETAVLRMLYDEQLELFKANPEGATALLGTGQAPNPNGIPATRHAATTVLLNAIMNLDETVRHK